MVQKTLEIMDLITTKDGFIWAVLDEDTALYLYDNEDIDVYLIFWSDDVQRVRINEEDKHLVETTDYLPVAIELGHEAELESDWYEATARNNEKRSFEAWLEDKAENLIN